MKLRTLFGLAAIGAYYAHRKRGGELTVNSIKDSLRAFGDSVGKAFEPPKRETSAPMASEHDDEESIGMH